MIKKCLKCNHVHAFKPGEPAEDCPGCGANYAQVEAALANSAAKTTATAAPPATRPHRGATPAPAGREAGRPTDTLSGLRAGSHYPTFRATANAAFFIGVLLAGILGLTAIGAMFKGEWAAFLGFTVGALLLFVIAKAAREASLMIADASDALVALVARRADDT